MPYMLANTSCDGFLHSCSTCLCKAYASAPSSQDWLCTSSSSCQPWYVDLLIGPLRERTFWAWSTRNPADLELFVGFCWWLTFRLGVGPINWQKQTSSKTTVRGSVVPGKLWSMGAPDWLQQNLWRVYYIVLSWNYIKLVMLCRDIGVENSSWLQIICWRTRVVFATPLTSTCRTRLQKQDWLAKTLNHQHLLLDCFFSLTALTDIVCSIT